MFIAKRRPPDSQRKRLYAAENQIKAVFRDPLPTIREVQGFVDLILRNRKLQTLFPASLLLPISVTSGRRQRTATAESRLSTITVPKRLRSKFIVIHEVCHILAERCYGADLIAGHGAEFATFEMAMVNHFLGAEDAHELREAFARFGVEHCYRGELP